MYHYLIGISIFKSFTPYFRKHIFKTLDGEEFLYINTFIIFLFVLVYFLYKAFKKKTWSETIQNYKNLNTTQILAIIFISTVAVLSSIFVFEFDRNHNTPLLNSIYMEAITTLSLIMVAIFLFKEKYKWSQIGGIFLVAGGLYLVTKK